MTITSRIIDGKYNFDQNVLELDIETRTRGTEGSDDIIERVRRKFDVTSLKVTKALQDSKGTRDIEVLGARTQSAMNSIMPKIIENFKAMPDCQSLIGKTVRRDQSSSIKFEMNREVDPKASSTSLKAGSGYTMKDVSGKVTSSASRLEFEKGSLPILKRVHQSESVIDNPKVVSDLLKASAWEDMIKDVEGPDQKTVNHAWKSSKSLKASPEQLDEIVKLFRGINPDTKMTRLGDAHAYVKEVQIPLLSQVDSRIEEVEEILAQAKSKIDSGHISSPEQLDRINVSIGKFNAWKKELSSKKDYIENAIPMLHRELAIIMAVQGLQEQKFLNRGEAPMGTVLTEAWDDLVSKFKLIPSSSDVHLEDHLNYQLGLTINLRNYPSKDEFTNFQRHLDDTMFVSEDEDTYVILDEVASEGLESEVVQDSEPEGVVEIEDSLIETITACTLDLVEHEEEVRELAPILEAVDIVEIPSSDHEAKLSGKVHKKEQIVEEVKEQAPLIEAVDIVESPSSDFEARLGGRVHKKEQTVEDIREVLIAVIKSGDEGAIAGLRAMPLYEEHYDEVYNQLQAASQI
ncbi:MAG: hypothetical protein S4CHLAM6_02710 [Chlamydiae bacterium]|nr:hypothetical protein [Chlamydiota bacterium]